MARKSRPLNAERMQRSALHYLQRYPATTESLRRVLNRRIRKSVALHDSDEGELIEAREELLRRLQEAGYLDDARYVAARVDELHRRGTSSRGIAAKLRAKGAPPELVDAALATLRESEPDAELTSAIAYARRRRIGPFHRDPERRQERHDKDLAALARQGFSYGVARRVIDGEFDEG